MVTLSAPETHVMALCVVGRLVVKAAVSRSPSVEYDPRYITGVHPTVGNLTLDVPANLTSSVQSPAHHQGQSVPLANLSR